MGGEVNTGDGGVAERGSGGATALTAADAGRETDGEDAWWDGNASGGIWRAKSEEECGEFDIIEFSEKG